MTAGDKPRVLRQTSRTATLLPFVRSLWEGTIMADKLTADGRKAALAKLKGWSDVPGRDAITRKFTFKNFKEAFAFMTKVADVANEMDHHPEWFNVYKTVEVTLSTHDAGGVTELDTKLATEMDRLAG
jgi:4a-hydroxytetrahydrobiopterin dehydratase